MLRKILLLTLYIVFLFVSVVPIIFEVTLPPPSAGKSLLSDRRGFAALFWYTHQDWVHPIVTILGFAAWYPQLRETSVSPGALSVIGLGLQAVVFFLLGLSWKFRNTIWYSGLLHWYQSAGWAVVENILFALVQGILGWFAWRARLIYPVLGQGECSL